MWRGTMLHELVSLPEYWKQVSAVQLQSYEEEVLQFGAHAKQYCLVLRPKTSVKAWVIYWHGGGWQFGTPEQFKFTAQPWLQAGYGVVLPSYRRLPVYQFSSIRADTIAALAACRRYWDVGGDAPDQPVVLLGMSAGGHIASLVGLVDQWRVQAGWIDRPVVGVIASSAVLDLYPMRRNPLIRRLAGRPGSTSFQMANPVERIHPQAPPFFVIHGTKDGLTPYQLAERFCQRYKSTASAERLRFETLPNGSHLDAGRWMYIGGELQRRVLAQAEEWVGVG
ncbi:MAG: alpha/beta hydrolase [Bacteroidota bacterium]